MQRLGFPLPGIVAPIQPNGEDVSLPRKGPCFPDCNTIQGQQICGLTGSPDYQRIGLQGYLSCWLPNLFAKLKHQPCLLVEEFTESIEFVASKPYAIVAESVVQGALTVLATSICKRWLQSLLKKSIVFLWQAWMINP